MTFLSPYVLLALLALPLIWWLMRATPPAPRRLRFPGTGLLFGLTDDAAEARHTPWWLLLLRCLALAAAILGFAQPVLAPDAQDSRAAGPMLLLLDSGWASAPEWEQLRARAQGELARAQAAGRPVALVDLARGWPDAEPLSFQSAEAHTATLAAQEPAPWAPMRNEFATVLAGIAQEFETVWISDGIGEISDLATELARHGAVHVVLPAGDIYALAAPVLTETGAAVRVLRRTAAESQTVAAVVFGRSAEGPEIPLARAVAEFAVGAREVDVEIALPPDLRNRITRISLASQESAGGTVLLDDRGRRRSVGLPLAPQREELPNLIRPDFYVRQALSGTADIVSGSIQQLLAAGVEAIILPEVAPLPEGQVGDLLDWVGEGGTLLRFSGPGLVPEPGAVPSEDPLLPVRLRPGGRDLGGAMSWGAPQSLAPFAADSPFSGLSIPGDVTVSAQVVAQPAPELGKHTYASLTDGTPLVTGKALGSGRLILFHVTADAEWSNLPLSGLFVQMLERLAVTGASRTTFTPAGRSWVPELLLDAQGRVYVPDAATEIAGEVLAQGASRAVPPGLYAADGNRFALNLLDEGASLAPAAWPAAVQVERLGAAVARPLAGVFLVLSLALLLLDIPASALASGRLQISRKMAGAALWALLAGAGFLGAGAPSATAQTDPALLASNETVLAYVRTGDAGADRKSAEGLRGLGIALRQRTTVEPAAPVGVDLETDEIAYYSFLYWPVTERQPALSPQSAARVNAYLRSGGMILFDTQDASISARGGFSPDLRRLTALLEIPPLEPVPENHVLTRTFYLLGDFPGRWDNGTLWVQTGGDAAPELGHEQVNDGVSPVLIGSNDWAAAWAMSETGDDLYPVGRGYAGERQRELARRFGINLIMYVLTGNYKSDQVHVPALLERLGQ